MEGDEFEIYPSGAEEKARTCFEPVKRIEVAAERLPSTYPAAREFTVSITGDKHTKISALIDAKFRMAVVLPGIRRKKGLLLPDTISAKRNLDV